MNIYPTDHVVTVKLAGDVMPAMIETLKPGTYPWQLRVSWQADTITMAFGNIATLLKATNQIGLAGGEIVSVTAGTSAGLT